MRIGALNPIRNLDLYSIERDLRSWNPIFDAKSVTNWRETIWRRSKITKHSCNALLITTYLDILIWSLNLRSLTRITVFRGINVEGGLAEVQQSDDDYLRLYPGFTISSSEVPIWVEFFGVALGKSTVDVESQAGTPGLTYTVEAWNWISGDYDEIGSQVEQFNSDQVVSFGMIADHIGSDGSVRSRVGRRKTGLTINFPWEVRIDHVIWN